ncbi:MFS transporter [Endozoicomonas sp. SM1973]|uniref:MFS transporter n=1 Tax=Spartinivicinus marinus TaxID=2994442 RepID=A0A853HT01_9GAMM|nr:MFS transporter [Spartinivicinus marinus]MCX4026587.1 MFS transporter [Spartinivicinus marinus]NYZ64423.1 MFS transporter [Spartinivicinus marinus]
MNTYRTPKVFLILLSIAMPLCFSIWQVLLNNFSIQEAGFTGREIGILQSLREIPGFLAFTAVFILLAIKEQRFAIVSLAILSIGVAISGLFPTEYGLYATTVLMSIGFHYLETVKQSLALQWLDKVSAPVFMGKLLAASSLSALAAYGLVWLLSLFNVDFTNIYLLGGSLGLVIVAFLLFFFPLFPEEIAQNKKLILRRRYWLYYLLTFLSGARRQIFIVFAAFMMVEKFGYSVAEISILFMINHTANLYLAPRFGKLIQQIGEKKALTIEYIGLILVFTGYGLVESSEVAATLYVIDHLFFAMAIAIKTYFQKIADPADIASSAGVSFTINHIAAVVIPAIFGIIWLVNPSLVFYIGALIACLSLIVTQLIPNNPEQGNETFFSTKKTAGQPTIR